MDWDSYLPTYVITPIFHLLMQEVGSDYGRYGGGGGGTCLPSKVSSNSDILLPHVG